MSYIKGTMTCHVCGKEYKYCWLYADGKFERVPSRDEYVEATTTNKVIGILLVPLALVDK